jgi:hypothetical protein
MKSPEELRAAALALASNFELTASERAERLARAVDADYWRALTPAIQITAGGSFESEPISSSVQEDIERHFTRERYFATPPLVGPSVLSRMNATIDAVRRAGWPAVFAMVSDDFWHCGRIDTIVRLLRARLGPGFRQIPHYWVHIVRAVDGAAGWPPHFDGLMNGRVSVWMALADSTIDNGCIYLVPPNLLPESFRTLTFGSVPMVDASRAMHATQPMPVPAGSALGWDFDVFHWGGRAVAPRGERRAISMEFIAAGEKTHGHELPLLDADGDLPTMTERLHAIGLALDQYAKREPTAQRFQGLAAALMQPDSISDRS